MKAKNLFSTGRRQFLTTVVPACALTCLFGKDMLAMAESVAPQEKQQAKHKFDEQYDKALSFRQVMRMRYAEAISIIKSLEKEMGKEKTIVLLQKLSSERMFIRAKKQAEQSPDNSMNTYVEQFRGGYENTLTKAIMEDTEKSFELKVTECIWASTFLDENMGDYGYALVCWADYAWAEGFNPKIKLVRDKTLMQGHDHCNHRYIFSS